MRIAMRYVLGLLGFLASVGASQHPICRSSSTCTKTHETGYSFYYTINGHQIIISFKDGSYFTLRCDSDSKTSSMLLDDPEMPAMLWPVTVDVAVFNQCLIPQTTYYDALKAFNVTVTGTLKLTLAADSKLEIQHLRGLQIAHLDISAVDPSKPPRASYDFLDGVPGLRTLKLNDVVPNPVALRHLPTSLEILNIVNAGLPAAEIALRNSNNKTQHWLERLKSIQSLHLVDSQSIVAQFPGEILTLPQLSLLPNLVSFSLYYMPLDSETLNWLKNSTIKNLILKSCGLTTLPRSMFENTQLTQINLANNKLTSLPGGLFTPLIDHLQELDLSHNNLNYEAVVDSVKQLKRLEILKANYNPLGSFCGDASFIKTNLPSYLPASLRRLALRNTSATRICSDWIRNDALMEIDLSYNNINDLSFSDLEMSRTNRGTVRVNLTHNKLRTIEVTRSDFEKCMNEALSPIPDDRSIITRVQVEIDVDKLVCDCEVHWLREVMRSCSLLKLKKDVVCLPESKPLHKTLQQYGRDEISCPYSGYCLPECLCEKRPRDNATIVRCSGVLPHAPRWPVAAKRFPIALHVAPSTLTAVPNVTLVELHAPNNNITELVDGDISGTLRVLDVRNNSISHIALAAAQVLGNLRAQKDNYSVYLSGNPLACKCEDASAFSHLNPVVGDWDSVQCVDMSLVSGKTERDLCPSSLPLVFGVVVPLLLLAVLALSIRIIFQRVKQFLFRHDLCADWLLRDWDDVDDADITDDVFLSYAHADLKKLQELKYGLEKLGYSTIEHQNDWETGEAILTQIESSVRKTRRTLLLVTDNFAESQWTQVEFQMAHLHALKTRTKRVLIVNWGLKKPEKLPSDLLIYMRNHTYLEWNVPRFWHKLRRFMPPPRQEYVQCRPDDLDPPSLQNVPLLEKNPEKPQLAIPINSITGASAC